MKKPSPTLQAEWRRKLAASGFVDIEHCDDGKRPGNRSLGPTPLVQSDTPEHRRRHLRVHDPAIAAQAREHAQDALGWYRFKSAEDRRIWEFYAEHGIPRDIGTHLGMSFRRARTAILRIRTEIDERLAREGNPGNQGKACLKKKIDQMVQEMDVSLLLLLAQGLPA